MHAPGGGLPEPENARLVRRLYKVCNLMRAELDRSIAELRLSYAQFRALEVVAASHGLHAGGVAQRLGVSRQAAHSLVARLARSELLALRPIEDGTRFAEITPEGRAILEIARRGTGGVGRLFGYALHSEDLSDLLEMLWQVERALDARAPHPRRGGYQAASTP